MGRSRTPGSNGASGQTPSLPEPNPGNLPLLEYLKQNPAADPVHQLLYAVLHTRKTLDRIDRTIRRDLRRTRGNPDPLFFSPVGKQLLEWQTQLRTQLGMLAKYYIGLGIEERQTRVIEDWSNILLPFIQNLMDDPDLALDRRQREKMPAVVERHLRVLERSDSA